MHVCIGELRCPYSGLADFEADLPKVWDPEGIGGCGSLTWGPNVLLRFYNSSAQRWKLQECAKLGGKRQVLSAPCSHLESL